MGVLETRALDFENVIILSMNERIYPRRNRQHTLIPQQIRHAYGLPASNDSELEYSYYFYRLFSRAKRVVCLYDSRANGAGNGAMSRYLLQFKYFSPTQNIYFSSPNIHAHVEKPRFIIVRKDKKGNERAPSVQRFRSKRHKSFGYSSKKIIVHVHLLSISNTLNVLAKTMNQQHLWTLQLTAL